MPACKDPEKEKERRKKLREANLGKKQSEETCKKKSEAFSGERNPMFGKHHSEETKRKIGEKSKIFMNSEKAKQIIHPPMDGENNPMFGKHHSEETKRKIGLKSIGRITLTEERKRTRSEEMRGGRQSILWEAP
jgi:hypothetical protein